jgi:hypothetical protein
MSQNNSSAQTAESGLRPLPFKELEELKGKDVRFSESFEAMCYFFDGKTAVKRVLFGTVKKVKKVNRFLAELEVETCGSYFFANLSTYEGVEILIKK